ncbi:hypothetical protein HaLaN_28672, partial [Haematococcus lacustris]
SGGVLLPRASPPQLPLDPRRFSTANSQARGLVGQLLRRLFSSQNKPRGFERFVPRSSLKAGAKVEPRKPADAGPPNTGHWATSAKGWFERFVPRSSLKAGAKVEPRKPADAGPGGNKARG